MNLFIKQEDKMRTTTSLAMFIEYMARHNITMIKPPYCFRNDCHYTYIRIGNVLRLKTNMQIARAIYNLGNYCAQDDWHNLGCAFWSVHTPTGVVAELRGAI